MLKACIIRCAREETDRRWSCGRYSDDSLRVTTEYMLEGAKTLVAFLEELAVEV